MGCGGDYLPHDSLLLVEGSGFFHHFEGFDNVADLDVVEVFEADTTFEVTDHFAGVVLMALEGGNLTGVHHHAVTEEAGKGVTGKLAVRDHTTGDDADLGHGEGIAHFGLAKVHFLRHRSEHAGHSGLDLFTQLVDDIVEADIDLFLFSTSLTLAVGRTLKPMMMALEAAASMISDSEIADRKSVV